MIQSTTFLVKREKPLADGMGRVVLRAKRREERRRRPQVWSAPLVGRRDTSPTEETQRLPTVDGPLASRRLMTDDWRESVSTGGGCPSEWEAQSFKRRIYYSY
ncbi:unnamed protein product [Caenorhabditis auriculariae]|uniref:Uncharacterized protein n=1 Tax=Caenorhabditis auriculariae TaxID=2777116 RepID=A0A8S1HGQ5_9PELO|nr:unnamed protein product [Caenorhabditis auriculariae]